MSEGLFVPLRLGISDGSSLICNDGKSEGIPVGIVVGMLEVYVLGVDEIKTVGDVDGKSDPRSEGKDDPFIVGLND